MVFSPSCNEVVFIGMRQLKSKAGKDFCIVKIADPDSYENLELIPNDPAEFSECAKGELIKVSLDVTDRFKTLYRVG